MQHNQKTKAIIFVNLSVLLFGLVGVFARSITLSALEMTFWRVLFSSISLAAFMLITRQNFSVHSKKDALIIAGAGAVLAIHWWSFLGTIQMAGVAIGTITFSSFPLFVTFLEPLVFHTKLRLKNIIIALIILFGVSITVPELSLENKYSLGILTGMFSTFLYAVMAILNKFLSQRYSSTLTAFYEQATAAFVLLPLVCCEWLEPARQAAILPPGNNLVYLLMLGIITTALAHTLFISSLKYISAQLAGVLSSMETVYGIVMAVIFLGEIPSTREIAGAVIIIGTILYTQLQPQKQE